MIGTLRASHPSQQTDVAVIKMSYTYGKHSLGTSCKCKCICAERHIVPAVREQLGINDNDIVVLSLICSKSSFGIAFDLLDDSTKRQTGEIPAGWVLPESCTCASQVIVIARGHSSSSRRQRVPCERTGRTRFRPRWPSSLASYCTCSAQHWPQHDRAEHQTFVSIRKYLNLSRCLTSLCRQVSSD